MRSHLCGRTNSHSAAFVLDPLEPRVLLSVGEVGQDAPTLAWGIDVAYSTGPGVMDVTPTGTQFTLFDYYGGTWVDCEKSPTDTDDDDLCWAAAASNVLDWTGWGFVSGMTNSDQIFTYFQDHYEDVGGGSDAAWQWPITTRLTSPSRRTMAGRAWGLTCSVSRRRSTWPAPARRAWRPRR